MNTGSSIIGIDIGTSSIKVVCCAGRGNDLTVTAARMQEFSAVGVEDQKRAAAASLRTLMKGIDTRGASIVVTLNCRGTAIKKTTVPYMPKSELSAGIMLEARTYFPFPTEGSAIDFEVLRETVLEGARKMDLMVAACPIATRDTVMAILSEAGISASSIVPTSYALSKLAEKFAPVTNRATCLLDVGASGAELLIVKDAWPMLSRKVPLGGNDITKAMTASLFTEKGKAQLSYDEAEIVKRKIGMPEANDEKPAAGSITGGQVYSMMRSPLEQLAKELDRSFDYYREESGGDELGQVMLFGGCGSLKGMDKYLAGEIGVPVVVGDPFTVVKRSASLEIDPSQAHLFDIAIGAAIACGKGINLLPGNVKEEAGRRMKAGAVKIAAAAVAVLAVLLFVQAKFEITNFNNKIAKAKAQLDSMGANVMQAKQDLLAASVLSDEPRWDEIVSELGNLLPEQIHLTRITVDDKAISLYGVVASADGEQILAKLVLKMEEGIFNSVKLVESKSLPQGGGISFELKCWVDYER